MVEALRRIVSTCKKYGVIAGLHNNTPQYALKMNEEGFQFVTIASESRFMAAKAAEEVAVMRQGQREGRRHSGLLRAAAHLSRFCEA